MARMERVDDLARRELIGLRARVVASSHAGYVGAEGLVVDESMRTFTLELQGPQGAREVVVPKAGQTFEFLLPDGRRERLEGRDLAHRHEDRTRKGAGGGQRRAR